ncbi:D site-binding protein [Toxocara canis]|uniref:D site-binding protein n=1 Tax=Toxocara canis TaxID=6265 RepID=A0A0B2V8U8_TOXCA|nr:D site-binding protein [Toxocara canis]
MAADIHSTLGSGARRYEHQLKAMSMCWQAFDPSSTYPSTAYPPTPSTAANAFHVPTVKNDQQAYRERRMKNNESARKSREMRRQKEESTQRRCDQLLHENSLLRAELSILRNQVEHFKHMLSVTATSQPFGTSTSQLP